MLSPTPKAILNEAHNQTKVISCFLGIFITDGALKIALLLHHHFHIVSAQVW
jgi:hypothetical protein